MIRDIAYNNIQNIENRMRQKNRIDEIEGEE
jgi:hypothetical protein